MPGGKTLPATRRGAVSPGTGRADARTTNRRFERAGGGADCHAGLENAFVPAGGRGESRGSRGDGPEEQVQGQGRVLPALALRNGALGKPRLRADGFSQLKLG